jgi:RNA polymerase sigma-70 factor (ECF subfamily)
LPDPAARDELLMLAAGKGDLDAFEEIVRRHQTWVWRTAYRFLGHEQEAEDMAQEAFLRILEAASRYQPSASFRTYFYRVLIRLCIDRTRKKQPAVVGHVPDVPDSSPGPEESLIEREHRAWIRKALDSLPPNQKAAIVLRHYEELSYGEIAQALDTTVKSVEGLIGRARTTLRSLLVAAEKAG